jgi:CubicO group peptidase (beta-lactamase class C family)
MRVAVMNPRGDAILDTVPASRKITIQDLMRHTSGLIYGNRGATAVHKLYPASSASAGTNMTGSEFAKNLSGLPLLYQPGTVWDYGFGLDLTGLVVESVEKQSLGQYLGQHVFTPLGMSSTGFVIPPAETPRYAKALPIDPETGQPQSLAPDLTKPLKFECGGGCAYSTAGDYMRFALMLLNKGKYGETRVLGRKTVEYMLSNQLGPEVKNLIGNADPTRADYGFGLGLAVRTTPGIVRMMGSVGDFSWPGASGTNWWADPQEDLVVVFMAHSPGAIRREYRQVINALVEQAIVD